MANRLLIGALLGATAATVYHKVKTTKPEAGASRISNIAERANERVDAAATVAEEKVDVVEQAVGEGIKFVTGAAHKLIGAGQDRAEGVRENIKRAATDYAKQAAKDQLSKQASRFFERISGEVQQATKAPAPKAQPAPAPKAAAEPAPTATEPPVPAMVRLEAERYARDNRGRGILAAAVDDERKAVTLFVTKDAVGDVPTELAGYAVHVERVDRPQAFSG